MWVVVVVVAVVVQHVKIGNGSAIVGTGSLLNEMMFEVQGEVKKLEAFVLVPRVHSTSSSVIIVRIVL